MLGARRMATCMTALAATIRAPPTARAAAARDSPGGLMIPVDLTRPVGKLRLSRQPLTDIGGAAAEREQLFRVQGVAFLSNGAIIIANGGTAQVKMFDANGRLVREAGRKGQGPGEF